MFPVAQILLLTGRLVLDRIPVLQGGLPLCPVGDLGSCLTLVCRPSLTCQPPSRPLGGLGFGLWAREGSDGDALKMTS